MMSGFKKRPIYESRAFSSGDSINNAFIAVQVTKSRFRYRVKHKMTLFFPIDSDYKIGFEMFSFIKKFQTLPYAWMILIFVNVVYVLANM